ncbi:MAG: branched-chain-amino-acid transaminase [Chthoniobacterales bacterium]|nr:branched-chain-amino-acid transaminase [Chthoniobacterales bacterium]
MQIYIDGQFFSEQEAKISVFDHGLLYGDGVFEGIRFYNGKVFCCDEHLERLYHSARAILLEIPLSLEEMKKALLETVQRNQLSDGYVRLIITRGKGSLGLNPRSCPKPTVIIIASTVALYPKEAYEKGLVVITCATRRMAPAALSPMIKSLNYLNNVMARLEALHAGADEGLLLNEQGFIAECTADNIFVVKKGVVMTPPASSGALAGISRAVAIQLALDMGLEVKEVLMTCYDVYTADECFLTGTAAEIVPVISLDRRQIGSGQPGTITKKLMQQFKKLTHQG